MTSYHAKVMLCVTLLHFYYPPILTTLSSGVGPMLFRVKRTTAGDFVTFMRVTVVLISSGIVIHAVIYLHFSLSVVFEGNMTS